MNTNLFNYGYYENNIVAMSNGSQELVKNIKKGDNIIGGIVECVVRIKPLNNPVKFYNNSAKLLVRGDTPIKNNNIFIIPKFYNEYEHKESEFLYLFLLQQKIDEYAVVKTDVCNRLFGFKYKKIKEKTLVRPNSIVINNTEVLTIANNLYQNFFSTEKIVNSLKKCKGWNNGLITFQENEKLFITNCKRDIVDINIIYEI